MPRVIHFEIPADDLERAKKFYETVFGWKIESWQGPVKYMLIFSGKDEPGIDGAIMPREKKRSKGGFNAYRCTIDVDNVDVFVGKVKEAGGEVISEKMAVPGVGYHIKCIDTEGNEFGIMQDDPKAK